MAMIQAFRSKEVAVDKIYRTSKKERLSFALYMMGGGMYNSAIGYIQVFYTSMGIAATAVGSILLTTHVWDAVNDPIFGLILDRVNLKGGKLLPWLKIATFCLPACVIFLFFMPAGISSTAKIVWGVAAYLLYEMAYTINDVPIFSMTSAMTDQVHERVGMMSRSSIISGLAVVLVMAGFPLLYNGIGWRLSAAAICVPAFLTMLSLVRTGKERYVNKDEEKVTLRVMWEYIKENKFLRIYYIGLTIMNITNTAQTVLPYFAANNLGDENLTAVLVTIVAAPGLFMALLLPVLTRRLDRFQIFMACAVGSGVIGALSYFVGYENPALFYGMLALRALCMGSLLVVQLMFTADIVEYGEYKTGKRLQGTAFSLQTFTFKFFNAVAAAAAMFILGAFGFVEGEGILQGPQTQGAIWFLFSLFPAIGVALSLPVMLRYRLRDRDVQVMAKVNGGEMAREEAEALFAGRY